jgi:hypothetical protein
MTDRTVTTRIGQHPGPDMETLTCVTKNETEPSALRLTYLTQRSSATSHYVRSTETGQQTPRIVPLIDDPSRGSGPTGRAAVSNGTGEFRRPQCLVEFRISR